MFTRRSLTTAGAVLILAAGTWAAVSGEKPAQPSKKPPQTPPAVSKSTAKPTGTSKPAPSPAPPAKAQAAKPATPPAASAKPQQTALSPADVVRAYLRHRDQKQDDKSYQLLSDASKKRWSADDWRSQARNVRATFGAVLAVAGEALLIGGGSVADNRIEKVTVKGDQAIVTVRQYVPIPTDIVLVKENGQWRIDMQKTMGISESSGQSTGSQTSRTSQTESTSPSKESTPTPPPQPDTTPQCRANARQIAAAIQLYALQHDGKLPDAANWTDAIRPLLTNPGVLRCPADSQHEVSFAMNQNLSGANLRDIKDGYKTVLIYESTTGKPNEAGRGETIPSPPRHTNGNVYIMADGTVDVKATKPQF
ncbi:MAG: hypothetical protein ACUVRO_14925 [Armatimonadota bacterium]